MKCEDKKTEKLRKQIKWQKNINIIKKKLTREF